MLGSCVKGQNAISILGNWPFPRCAGSSSKMDIGCSAAGRAVDTKFLERDGRPFLRLHTPFGMKTRDPGQGRGKSMQKQARDLEMLMLIRALRIFMGCGFI